jgi:hypothetical protein
MYILYINPIKSTIICEFIEMGDPILTNPNQSVDAEKRLGLRGTSILWSVDRISFMVQNKSLVGGLNPSEKYEFVSWDDEIPNWMEK